MIADVELRYRQHLTDADRRLLQRVAGTDAGLVAALSHPDVEAAVFGEAADDDGLLAASPFLTFAVAVHRTAVHLETATSVTEWVGPRQRVPVFDVPRLRELLADPARRAALVELLASYTHVASGAVWQRTARGWRRRRFSELDPVRLASLLEVVSPAERAGVFRRLGDLALFLTGVFPDHTDLSALGPVDVGRLMRATGLRADAAADRGGVALLEELGARWYRAAVAAAAAAGVPRTQELVVVGELGERFADARRVLDVVTQRYLFPRRERWFGRPST